MAGRLFDKWEQEAFRAGIQARTKESMNWFKNRVGGVNVSRQGLIRQGPQRSRRIMGAMMMFTYDPKLKKTLQGIQNGSIEDIYGWTSKVNSVVSSH